MSPDLKSPVRSFFSRTEIPAHIYIDMIADFHNDYLTNGAGPLGGFAPQVRCMVCALFRGRRSAEEIGKLLERFARERREGQYLGLEDAGYAAAYGIGRLADCAPVYASLTWNYENELAGGCLEDTGLKSAGEKVIAEMNRLGIAVDCAHLGKKAFLRVAELADKIVDSHTCAAAVWPHPRNLEDWQIAEIASHGGVVGITFVGAFLSAQAAAADVFRHMDYCVQKFGIGHFCFGSDFYGTEDLPDGLKNYADTEDLKNYFIRAGYTNSDINKIFTGNLSVFLTKK